RVDERGDAALLLAVGDRVERERGLAARLRAVDLHDATARVTADAEGDVEREAAGRHDGHVRRQGLAVLETHDGAFAVLLLDGGDRYFDGFLSALVVSRAVHESLFLAGVQYLYTEQVDSGKLLVPQ